MKLSRVLAAALFASACSSEPARQDATPSPEPEAAPQATTGEQPEDATPPPASQPAPRKAVEPAASKTERADARAAATGPVTLEAAEDGVNADAAILQDFHARVAAYMKIHKDAAKGDAKPKETENPGDISATQDALAARMQAARSTAKQGDIFTAEIRHKFRRLLAPELKGEDGRAARAVMKDDAPAPGSIPFKVNAKYPEGAPVPTVPANVLLNLPTLPDPLEYRIIGKHLLLLDTAANLIVDYVPNAIR